MYVVKNKSSLKPETLVIFSPIDNFFSHVQARLEDK